MKQTIALPALIAELAKINSCPDETASEFLHALARVISKGLVEDGAVTITGIGIFKIVDKPDGTEVEFLPDADVGAEINAPFALFEPVELAPGVTLDGMDMPEASATESSDHLPSLPPLPPRAEFIAAADTVAPAGTDGESTDETNISETVQDDIIQEPETVQETPIHEQSDTQTRTVNESYSQTTRTYTASQPPHVREERIVKVVDRRPNITAIILASVLALICGLVVGYFSYGWINYSGSRAVNISAESVSVHPGVSLVVTEDSISDTQTTIAEPSKQATLTGNAIESKDKASNPASIQPKVITDTVNGKRFLSVIAREHYGKDIFWVYIYEENKSKIADPNNVPNGLVVTIPPAAKYGIDAANPESIHAAERKALEIRH